MLNAALSRLEAAIVAAQSQEARVASLVEQAMLLFLHISKLSHIQTVPCIQKL